MNRLVRAENFFDLVVFMNTFWFESLQQQPGKVLQLPYMAFWGIPDGHPSCVDREAQQLAYLDFFATWGNSQSMTLEPQLNDLEKHKCELHTFLAGFLAVFFAGFFASRCIVSLKQTVCWAVGIAMSIVTRQDGSCHRVVRKGKPLCFIIPLETTQPRRYSHGSSRIFIYPSQQTLQ